MSDQLHTAIDTKDAAPASRCRMLCIAASSRTDAPVDDATTCGAMAHRCIRASMVQVVARLAPLVLSHPRVPLLRAFDYGSRIEHCASASRGPRAPHPRSARVLPSRRRSRLASDLPRLRTGMPCAGLHHIFITGDVRSDSLEPSRLRPGSARDVVESSVLSMGLVRFQVRGRCTPECGPGTCRWTSGAENRAPG